MNTGAIIRKWVGLVHEDRPRQACIMGLAQRCTLPFAFVWCLAFATATFAAKTHEFEDYPLLGIVAKDVSGFQGWAYVGRFDRPCDFVEAYAYPANAGTHTVGFRYACNGATDATRTLYVNGAKTATLSFPRTGSWSTWSSVSASVQLKEGFNRIRLQYDSDNTGDMHPDNMTGSWNEEQISGSDPSTALSGLRVKTVAYNRLRVSWNPASGAASYKIYRDGTKVANVTATEYVDTVVKTVSQQTYAYKIRALNASGAAIAAGSATSSTTLDTSMLPNPICDGKTDWIAAYWRAWQIAWQHVNYQAGMPAANYLDEAFASDHIWVWDTGFMIMWGILGGTLFPAVESNTNFLRMELDDGAIPFDPLIPWLNQSMVPWDAMGSTQPPTFAWAEWEYYLQTGDSSRFSFVLPALERHIRWIETTHKIHMNNLYETTFYGCGMDNTIRFPDNIGGSNVNPRYGVIDLASQQAMQMLYSARIAGVLGQTQKQQDLMTQYDSLKNRINQYHWNEPRGFYYDVLPNSVNHSLIETPASFWPMIAEVASPQQALALTNAIMNPAKFWRQCPIPTAGADQPGYDPHGGYWRGSVWGPTTYETVAGLRIYGLDSIARKIAEKTLDHIAAVLKTTNTIWENYAPDFVEGHDHGDFVGMTGVLPINLLIEDVLGFRPDAPHDTLTWIISQTCRNGIERYTFGDHTVSLIADARGSASAPAHITASANRPFILKTITGSEARARGVPAGSSSFMSNDPISSISLADHSAARPRVSVISNGRSVIFRACPVASGPVALSIITMSGRVIRHLAASDEKGRTMRLLWDGTDSDGRPCAKTMYIGRLSIDGGRSVFLSMPFMLP